MEIGVTDQMTQQFLSQLDPCNFQKITFSDIVQLLSTHMPEDLSDEQTRFDQMTGHRDSANYEASISSSFPLSDHVQNCYLLDDKSYNHVKRPSTNQPCPPHFDLLLDTRQVRSI